MTAGGTLAPDASRASHDWSGLEGWREALAARLAPHCRDANEVEDIVQETLLRAARHRGGLRTPDRLRPWLLRIAFNALRDLRRRSRHLGAVPLEEALDVPARDGDEGGTVELVIGSWRVPRDEAVEHLRSVRSELREDDRRLLDAFYGGEPVDPDVPQHLVKVRLYRARRRLQRALRRSVARRGAGRFVAGAVAEEGGRGRDRAVVPCS